MTALGTRRITPAGTPWLWNLRPPQPDDEATVVILPHAGGSTTAFLDWVPAIPAGIAVLGAQYPGRGPRMAEPNAHRLADLADPLTELLADRESRLVVVGHSLGAVVGLEVVRALERQGRPVHALVASSARAPDSPTLYEGETVPEGDDLAAALRRWGGLPAAVLDHPELLDMVLGSVHDDLALLEDYARTADRAAAHVDCPVAVVCGRHDPLVPVEMVAGWQRVTEHEVPVHLLDGGHFHAGADVARVGELIGGLTR